MKISHPSAAPKLLALLLAASSSITVPADEPREKSRPDAEAREKSERETESLDDFTERVIQMFRDKGLFKNDRPA